MKKVLFSLLGLVASSNALASDSIPAKYHGCYQDIDDELVVAKISANKIVATASVIEFTYTVEKASSNNKGLVLSTHYNSIDDVGKKGKGKERLVLRELGKEKVALSNWGNFKKVACHF